MLKSKLNRSSLLALALVTLSWAGTSDAQAQSPAVAGAGAVQTPAQTPAPAARAPAFNLALEAAQTALAVCQANGYKVGVSVVDSAGVLRVLLASDGALQRAVESGNGKAFTAITYRTSSAEVARKAEADPTLAAKLSADPKQRARAGALPLIAGNEVIGAIGVGGAPGGEKDEACAAAGLDKIKDRLN